MSRLSNVRVTVQIWIALGVALLGTIAVAAISLSTISAVRIKSPAYERIYLANVLLADVLPPPEYVIESRLVVLEMVQTTDPTERKALEGKLTTLENDFKARVDFWSKNSLGTKFEEKLSASQTSATAFYDVNNTKFKPAVDKGDLTTAKAIADGELKTIYTQHRAAVDEVVKFANEYNTDAEKAAVATLGSRNKLLWATIAAVLLLSLGLGWVIIRALTRQLQGATHTLADATNKLKESAKAIRVEAGKTAKQSADVAATGDSVSVGISTIAAACDELTASITEISRAASEAVNVANDAVSEADSAMAIVGRLDASSGEINNVVELISTIAEQTNLLALNATIEAARAGESGRGFAVVANEVKELANKTSVATGEIAEKIRNVQNESSSAIESIRRVADIVSQINGIQTTVAGAVEEQVATTNEIARSLNEAATGTTIVTEAIGAVASSAEGVETNVTTTEDVGRYLGDLTADLQHLVGAH